MAVAATTLFADDGSGGGSNGGVVFTSVDRDISFGPILLTASNRLMHSFDLRVIMAANVHTTIVHSGSQSIEMRYARWPREGEGDREEHKKKKHKRN